MHTAVKIEPRYQCPTIHVLDASRSAVVVSALLDEKKKEDFILDVKEEYEDLREEHYEGLKDRRYLTYSNAKEKKFKINWDDITNRPCKPTFLGTKVIKDIDLNALMGHIDWNPFFQVW